MVLVVIYCLNYDDSGDFGVFGFGCANRLVLLFLNFFLPISSFSCQYMLHPDISDLALDHYQSVSGIWKDGNRIVKILTHSGKGHQAYRIKRAYIGLLGIDL